MVLGVGAGEQIVGQAELLEQLEEAGVVVLVDLQRGGAFGIGAHRDRRAVRVGAGDHQHLVARQAVVAGEDIGRQVRAGDIADMDLRVGIRPGDGDQNSSQT